MKNIYFALLFLLLLTICSFGQLKQEDVVNKEFFLKVPIPNSSDCKMLISPIGIHTKRKICSYTYDEIPIFSNFKVKITAFGKRKKWTRVTYKIIGTENTVTIYLKGSSKKSLSKSFDITFSKDEVKNYGKLKCQYGDSKLKLFQCWGFPSSISKEGDLETYQYNLEFVGLIYGDMSTVEIKDGKIISIGVIL